MTGFRSFLARRFCYPPSVVDYLIFVCCFAFFALVTDNEPDVVIWRSGMSVQSVTFFPSNLRLGSNVQSLKLTLDNFIVLRVLSILSSCFTSFLFPSAISSPFDN